jgi:hypothetical protein
VTTHKLDLRPGGELHDAMTAVVEPQIAFTKKAGMPVTTESASRTPRSCRNGAYTHVVDSIPGVEAYEVGWTVDLYAPRKV